MDEKLSRFIQAAALTLETSPELLKPEANLKEQFDIDSMKRFMLMADIEEVYGASLNYCSIQNCETFGDIIKVTEAL